MGKLLKLLIEAKWDIKEYLVMKYVLLFLLCFFAIAPKLPAQSIVTNILFGQADVVYKGKVEKINYTSSNGQGDNYLITTTVEKVYKSNLNSEKVGISVDKFYEIDTIAKTLVENYQFQVKKDSTYIFFVHKLREVKSQGKFIYFADLVDLYIEGIPFSYDLEKELSSFGPYTYLKSRGGFSLPFDLLFQSSPIVKKVNIQKKEKFHDHFELTGTSQKGDPILIKTQTLHCICETGQIELYGDYLFFLYPYEKGKYLLMDKWLGVYQLNLISKNSLNFYDKMRSKTKY